MVWCYPNHTPEGLRTQRQVPQVDGQVVGGEAAD